MRLKSKEKALARALELSAHPGSVGWMPQGLKTRSELDRASWQGGQPRVLGRKGLSRGCQSGRLGRGARWDGWVGSLGRDLGRRDREERVGPEGARQEDGQRDWAGKV